MTDKARTAFSMNYSPLSKLAQKLIENLGNLSFIDQARLSSVKRSLNPPPAYHGFLIYFHSSRSCSSQYTFFLDNLWLIYHFEDRDRFYNPLQRDYLKRMN